MSGDNTPPPIVVNQSPTPAQILSAVRWVITALGVVASTLGYTGAAGKISGLLQYAGPIAAGVGFLLSQWEARRSAKTKTALANALPNSIAQTK